MGIRNWDFSYIGFTHLWVENFPGSFSSNYSWVFFGPVSRLLLPLSSPLSYSHRHMMFFQGSGNISFITSRNRNIPCSAPDFTAAWIRPRPWIPNYSRKQNWMVLEGTFVLHKIIFFFQRLFAPRVPYHLLTKKSSCLGQKVSDKLELIFRLRKSGNRPLPSLARVKINKSGQPLSAI